MGYKPKDGLVWVGANERVQGHAIGMQAEERAALRGLLDDCGTIKGDAIWLPPGIKGEVKLTTWLPKGNMRDCSWVSFRVKKSPHQ